MVDCTYRWQLRCKQHDDVMKMVSPIKSAHGFAKPRTSAKLTPALTLHQAKVFRAVPPFLRVRLSGWPLVSRFTPRLLMPDS